MSVISNRHTVLTLDKSSKALSGQRLARVIAKKNKDGEYESPNLTESKCVSIPRLENPTQEQLTAMMPHIVGMLSDVQDNLIRETIIKTGAKEIAQEDISIDACIKYLDSDSSGGRITTAYLQQWFTETYSDSAYEFIAHMCKFGADFNSYTDEQLKVIETKSNVLRDMFAGWASGKYQPDMPKCRGMIRFVEFCGVDSVDSRMAIYHKKASEQLAKLMSEVNSDALGF